MVPPIPDSCPCAADIIGKGNPGVNGNGADADSRGLLFEDEIPLSHWHHAAISESGLLAVVSPFTQAAIQPSLGLLLAIYAECLSIR